MDIAATKENWLEEITAKLKPNRKTVQELENYLIRHYHATPMELPKDRLRFVEQEIILRHYTEAGKQKIPMDITAYQFSVQQENCAGTFTLVLERITEEIYHLDFASARAKTDKNALNAIMKDILLYLGLSQQDIEKRTPRFLQYITTLCYYRPIEE